MNSPLKIDSRGKNQSLNFKFDFNNAIDDAKRFRSQTTMTASAVLPTSNISRTLLSVSHNFLNEEREKNILSLNSKEKELNICVQKNRQKIEEIEEIVQQDKTELKNYCKLHKEFLLLLLKDGKDARYI